MHPSRIVIMGPSTINSNIIEQINQGDERAFEVLYNSYFVYLCACANSYIFNFHESQDIVNDIFMKIWGRRGSLSYPIHAYLIQAVKNGCLNYLRSLHNQERIIDEYRESLLEFQEEYCITDNDPLQFLEMEELQTILQQEIASLPDKCRFIFEKYLYAQLTQEEIAAQRNLSVSTIRVHIKHAMDRLKQRLGNRIGFLLFFLF
mgnify:FL=1